MNMFAKDIVRTLLIKLVFLLTIWFVCFKGVPKNNIVLSQWLYGANHPSEAVQQHSFKKR